MDENLHVWPKAEEGGGGGMRKTVPTHISAKKKKSAPYDACISDEFFVVGRFFFLLSLEAGKFAATNNTECHFFLFTTYCTRTVPTTTLSHFYMLHRKKVWFEDIVERRVLGKSNVSRVHLLKQN